MHFILKYALKLIFFLASSHRKIGIRDFQAAMGATAILSLLTIVPAALHIFTGWRGSSAIEPLQIFMVVLPLVLAFVPIVYIVKLRRFGITDADYSVATGINYKAALKSARAGFQFLGIGASKLTAEEPELREAIRIAARSSEPIKMLLVDPDAKSIFQGLEKMDGTTGYAANVKGSVLFLETLAQNNENFMKLRFYQPITMEDVKPFRLFFADNACLVSPFSPSTGEKDQGRNLPQLRISAVGFPNASEPTLYVSLKKYFEKNWNEAEEKKDNAN
ncbi:hypothetical protein OKW43_003772 [Paraburkholderia sp. WC7.3g]|uniref:hypothetical protein n=1 Tax=Paraburkholderia sp. WC7.3g TaxID=2991070 RepID=UPI003D1FB8C6